MSYETMSGIFANAVNFIKMGTEGYAQATLPQALFTVRNSYAGALLLCKEMLIREAPLAEADDTIRARYAPAPP